MVNIDAGVELVPGETPLGAELLGRVVAVSGSQVTVQFKSDLSSPGADSAEVTVGSLLGIVTGNALAIGALCEMALEDSPSDQLGVHAIGRVDLLGEIADLGAGEKAFHRGIVIYPTLGSTVVPVGDDELKVIFDLANPHTIEVGQLQQSGSIPAYVNVDEIVQKHFAIVGGTGAGKSTGLALILRKIMQARGDLRILLIDTHNEYANCFGDRGHVLSPENLSLPFWLFNFEETVQVIFGARTPVEQEVILLAELVPMAKMQYARRRSALRTNYRHSETDGGSFTVDTPVPYRVDDLIALAQARMGKLENSAVAIHYQRLIMRLQMMRTNPRYGFIFDEATDGDDTMIDVLCQILRLKSERKPIAVVQLAEFPAETMEVVVSVLFRMAFDFGVWSEGASPLLIVCEEAHNYANADREIGFAATREGLSRIAKEGRKHGVFLGLVTQRPHQLDPTLISQCSTVFAMRLGHEDDQKIVRSAVADSASRLLAFLPSLGMREALATGAGVPTVMRLRFEELPQQFIPRSQAGWDGNPAGERTVDEPFIAAVVARWRGMRASNRPAADGAHSRTAPQQTDAASWSLPSFQD